MHKYIDCESEKYVVYFRHVKNISRLLLLLWFFNALYSIQGAIIMAVVHTGFKTTFVGVYNIM